jgi:hypothetical protein
MSPQQAQQVLTDLGLTPTVLPMVLMAVSALIGQQAAPPTPSGAPPIAG